MKAFELIIFDLDGTLIDSYPAIIASVNYTLQRYALPRASSKAIRRAVGWGDHGLIAQFFEKKDVAGALSIYRKHHRHSLKEKISFMPYAKRLLVSLKKKGYMLAIASNRPRRFLNIIIRHLHCENAFDYIVCKDQIVFGKPHPSMLNKIIRRAQVKKQKVLYVGDMTVDIQAGKRAHIATCALTTGSSSYRELQKEKPNFLFKNLIPLFSLLQAIHDK